MDAPNGPTRAAVLAIAAAVTLCAWPVDSLALDGWAVYASGGNVYRCKTGGSSQAIYTGGGVAHACWSATAKYVYFVKTNGEIWRMNNDGSGAARIATGANTSYNPIAAYRPSDGYCLYVNGGRFYKIDGATGAMTQIHSESRTYVGELAINTAGTRMAARDSNSDLYKITVGGSSSIYDTDCSGSISPDGNYLTANVGTHTQLDIYRWDGSKLKTLDQTAGYKWDNQKFVVNDNDYVVFNYDGTRSAVGVVRVSDNSITAVGDRSADYPDFFVGANLPPVSANQPPTCSLTSPANGASFAAPATITIGASASDPDGSVTRVEFFQGSTKLGEDANPPYSFAWSAVPAGTYSLTARATDDLGATATSAAVSVTVSAPGSGIVIECEAMSLDGYASEGDWIATMSTGTATAAFPGPSGIYTLRVTIVKEDDGQPTLDIYVGGAKVGTIVYPLGSSSRDPETVTVGVVTVGSGAEVELVGTLHGGAAARVDRLVFEPSSGGGDSDADGLPDSWEMQYFGSPSLCAPGGDPDGDGLTNAFECSAGTDPTRADTDGDGLGDGWEINFGMDPLDPDGNSDGVPDGDEDSDGDGFTNAEEAASGSNPFDPNSRPGGSYSVVACGAGAVPPGARGLPFVLLAGLAVAAAKMRRHPGRRKSAPACLAPQEAVMDPTRGCCATLFAMAVSAAALAGTSGDGTLKVTGELRKWHKVTLTMSGPWADEAGTPNPFTDYRMTVTFRNGTAVRVVPGYFAADGNAANTSATSGTAWRAHLAPDLAGVWSYEIDFRAGPMVAVEGGGTALAPYHGKRGSFTVGPTDKTGRDHRAKGRLQYVGRHHLRFAETGEYFLKGGADSPENLLAYADFDGDFKSDGVSDDKIKTWAAHVADWRPGDPVWQGDKGKGLVGAINYLASKGMNAFSFLTMNIEGDDRNVFPYTSYGERYRMDCSRLDQWEVVFEHADRMGMYLHFKTQETENELLLDGGALGPQRKLYYRELIARFAHHLALNWNLGEEDSDQTDAQRRDMARYFYDNDPYHHPIVIHTYPGAQEQIYRPLLGSGSKLTGASIQINWDQVHAETAQWVDESAAAGRPWVVANDEQGGANSGVLPDANDYWHDGIRKQTLWGNLMAGGGGVEYYFGYSYAHSDLTCQDFRSRDHMWDLTCFALDFFRENAIPFWEMRHDDSLTSATGDFVLAKPGEVYAVYLPNGGTTNLDLGPSSGVFAVGWFDPRSGGALRTGSVAQVAGPGARSLGDPPSDPDKDWAVLVRRSLPAGRPPSVSLLNPSTGSVYSSPATIELAASASDPDGQVATVEFFEGATKLGEDTEPPYRFTWSNVQAGTYALTARAVDDLGLATDSLAVVVTVRAPAPTVITWPAAGCDLVEGRAYALSGTGAGTLQWSYDANSDGLGEIVIGPGASAQFAVPAGVNPPRQITFFLSGDGGKVGVTCSIVTSGSQGDLDVDGLADSWEELWFGDASASDPDADPDGDGLTNAEEYSCGTDPTGPDTDADGLRDDWELALGSNPLSPDSDADWISDGDEDSDGDGFTDAEEAVSGSDPRDPDSRPGGGGGGFAACGPAPGGGPALFALLAAVGALATRHAR